MGCSASTVEVAPTGTDGDYVDLRALKNVQLPGASATKMTRRPSQKTFTPDVDVSDDDVGAPCSPDAPTAKASPNGGPDSVGIGFTSPATRWTDSTISPLRSPTHASPKSIRARLPSDEPVLPGSLKRPTLAVRNGNLDGPSQSEAPIPRVL